MPLSLTYDCLRFSSQVSPHARPPYFGQYSSPKSRMSGEHLKPSCSCQGQLAERIEGVELTQSAQGMTLQILNSKIDKVLGMKTTTDKIVSMLESLSTRLASLEEAVGRAQSCRLHSQHRLGHNRQAWRGQQHRHCLLLPNSLDRCSQPCPCLLVTICHIPLSTPLRPLSSPHCHRLRLQQSLWRSKRLRLLRRQAT